MAERCLRLLLACAFLGMCQRPAVASVDISGGWYLQLNAVSPPVYLTTLSVTIVQAGTALTWTLTSTGETLFTGTIDIDTGAFTVTGGRCPSVVDTLTGTAALDSSGFTANGNLHYPEVSCGSFTVNTNAIGVRGVCGDGSLTAVGEVCDDGNTDDGDCCSSKCEYEVNGSPCTDGNASTCEICNGNGTCATSVCPSFDVSGTWTALSSFPQFQCLELSQSGTGISAVSCVGSAPPMIGTVDPVTREFSLTQQPEICRPPFSGDYCALQGTFSADFSSWNGFWWCYNLDTTPPYPCEGYGESISATREVCGDFYVNVASGEQCDDGNTDPNNCCSSTCQFEPVLTACSNGSGTCGTCDASGTCQSMPCPFELDHYKCYDGADLHSPAFTKVAANTSDQLSNEQIRVDKLKYVCTPVDKNGEGISDPAGHLACYKMSGALLNPRPQVEVSSQFQTSRFELKRARLMCIPASKVLLP